MRAIRPPKSRPCCIFQQLHRVSSKVGSSQCLLPNTYQRRTILTLGIETSCDDTSVAVLEVNDEPAGDEKSASSAPSAILHFHERKTSNSTAFEGIHPAIAARSHPLFLKPIVDRALAEGLPDIGTDTPTADQLANAIPIKCLQPGTVKWKQKPDLIAVTRGPGMTSSLGAGLGVAQGLSSAFQIPLIGVHHMLGHAWTPGLCTALGFRDRPQSGFGTVSGTAGPSEFPSYSLLVSGGHTMLVYSHSPSCHRILTNTLDMAVGDALDKAGRMILPDRIVKECSHTSYGALLEDFAFPESENAGLGPAGDPDRYKGVYTPPSRSAVGTRRVHPRWGWSFNMTFAERTRADIYDSIQGAARRNARTAPLVASNRDEMVLPFSFSGIVSNVERFVDPSRRLRWNHSTNGFDRTLRARVEEGADPVCEDERRDLAQATLTIVFETLAEVVIDAIASHQKRMGSVVKAGGKPVPLIMAGGVSANTYLRHVLRSYLSSRTIGEQPETETDQRSSVLGQSMLQSAVTICPAPSTPGLARELCTDNAIMIAWAGTWMHRLGIHMSREKEAELVKLLDFKSDDVDRSGIVTSVWSLEDLETRGKQ